MIEITDHGEQMPEPLIAPRNSSIPYNGEALQESKTEGGLSGSVYAGGGTGDLPTHLRSKTITSPETTGRDLVTPI